MIIVTGGAGFIGSNLVQALNARGRDDIWIVDNLTDGTKFRNLVDCHFDDYVDKQQFLAMITDRQQTLRDIEVIFHLGACSTTTQWDGRYLMENNYRYSRTLLDFAVTNAVRYIYASSAAVYGNNPVFVEDPRYEQPLNVYGYSKLVFDQQVRKRLQGVTTQVAGLRYFNVYGPREQHKGPMASVAYHLNRQLESGDRVKLFTGSGGYGPGAQQRDFIAVDDVVAVNLWLFDHPSVGGIYNVGTGRAQTFNDVAEAVLRWHGRGEIEYIPFPAHLVGAYQSFTQADVSALRGAGYNAAFTDVATGVKRYLDWLHR